MNTDKTNVAELDRINLRLSGDTFRAIDSARSVRPGRVSRNTWIAEAIGEKLARDIGDRPSASLEQVGNA